MDVHLSDGELRIKLPPGNTSRLFVGGTLQAEFGLGASGPEDLRKELRRARSAQAACSMMGDVLKELKQQAAKPDHVVKSARRGEAFAAGLEMGLRGEHRVLGGGTHLGMREAASVVEPEHKLNGPTYSRGWSLGCAIFAAVAMAAGEDDPRKSWGTQ